MKVFFDNCTSPTLALTLNGYLSHLGHGAIHIRDLPCGRSAADTDWMRYLAKSEQDWLVVTGDGRIHKNRAERYAFRRANLKGIVLAPAYQKTPVNQQCAFLLWRWPDIEQLIKLASPFLFELPMNKFSGIKQLPI